ncbi:MAG: DNA-binding protein [Clostridia bacterium]|nr:DNA-binding protein [Clostridia bacterium]
MKEKDFSVCLLYDIYSPLISEKKRTVFELSFWEDMSLSEIAEHTGTTRQGVRELIKRTCDELEEYERLMHLKNTRDRLFEIADGTEDKDLAEKIRKVLE